MAYKRQFCQGVYDEHDMACKIELQKIMERKGYTLIGDIKDEHYKKYDLKFYSKKDNKYLKFENEYRFDFDLIVNRWLTFHIPIRKINTQCDYYIVWGGDYNKMAIIDKKQIDRFAKLPITVTCTKVATGYDSPEYVEEFINIPINYIDIREKNKKGNWVNIKI